MANKKIPIVVTEETRERLAKFKAEHEREILEKKGGTRRFVSWDDVIGYLFDNQK
jgi:hypothetical protein